MARRTYKGKLLLFLYLCFVFSLPLRIFGDSSSDPALSEPQHMQLEVSSSDQETETGLPSNEIGRQEVLLHKLEELVKNLGEIVEKLEPVLLESSKFGSLTRKQFQEREKSGGRDSGNAERLVEAVQNDRFEGKGRAGERGRAVSVTKYSPFWSERFQFVSAVKLDSDATCVNVLPFRDYEGLSKYVAVGDNRGRVYVLLRNGDVLVEFYTGCDSPVTAMVSYLPAYKNESIVVTGHESGLVLVHKVHERSNGEELNSFYMENVGRFVPDVEGKEGSAIMILDVHHVGRSRYIFSSDVGGKLTILRENGTLHGSATLSSKPLAFLKQRLLFLTETGAGSLDLRSMKIKESECEGLNHSSVRNYAFDATERSKAYGFTSDGNLIHVLLLGDIMNFKCRVRYKRKIDIDEPLSFQAIKGYVLIVSSEKVFVFNVSSQHYARAAGPRLLFSAGLDEVRSSFLNYKGTDPGTETQTLVPLIASDHEKLVVIGLGSGYVGMYHSNLPVFKGEFNTMLWTSPVLFFILFLFAVWHFFAKKKEALTSWGPDDPFSSTSTTTGQPIGSATGERTFVDSASRSSDVMDLRGSGLRGPQRRYGSPTRYNERPASSFRPNSTDTNTRPSSVDPNYRVSTELMYRGPGLDSTGFAKRRESLFGNTQVIEDSS